jgi:hypothetical protein
MDGKLQLRQRQVHLDFHTPGDIRDVGVDFDADAFAETVRAAHIDSVTVFSNATTDTATTRATSGPPTPVWPST